MAILPMLRTTEMYADEDAIGKNEQAANSDPSIPRPSPRCAWQDKSLKNPGKGTHADPYVVDWDLADPENPFNWSNRRRWVITFQVGVPLAMIPVAAAGPMI